jgi:hypothetical protein
MTVPEVLWVEGDKYMWDGLLYETKEAAEAKKAEYEAQDFETELVKENSKFLVYTRRVVTEIVLEGEAPI